MILFFGNVIAPPVVQNLVQLVPRLPRFEARPSSWSSRMRAHIASVSHAGHLARPKQLAASR
jgi:hypothetical protein